MKSKIVGALNIILGAVIAVGTRTFLHVCGGGMNSGAMGDGMGDSMQAMQMPCAGVPNASLIVGIILAVLGLVIIIAGNKKIVSTILGALSAIAGVVVIGIPTFIIGVCSGAHMHCHMVTRPALIIIGALVIILGIVAAIPAASKSENE